MVLCTNSYLVVKTCRNTPRELTAKLSGTELSGALLNSVNSSFITENEARVTVIVAKARYHKVIEKQAKQRIKHSARS